VLHEHQEQKKIAQRASHGRSAASPPLKRRDLPPSFVAFDIFKSKSKYKYFSVL
jgi:hypothetical protein